MPKTNSTRRRYGSTSMFTNDQVSDPSTGKSKYVPNDELRNSVGDQGADNIKKARTTKTQADDIVSSSDAQETPHDKRIRLKKAMEAENEELLGKVKSALSKKGGATSRSNYE